jgi:protein TonB
MRPASNKVLIFLIVTAVHIAALFAIVFSVSSSPVDEAEPGLEVMKLSDISEAPPPPIDTQPPAEESSDPIAENLIETDKIENVTTTAKTSTPTVVSDEEYLPQNKISVLPKFSESEILSRLVYPSIAMRSGIEGIVYLELFVNKQGLVTKIRVLKETPEDRGFGVAATAAFTGLRGTPAKANEQTVAVRYRYPVRFQLKN